MNKTKQQIKPNFKSKTGHVVFLSEFFCAQYNVTD